MNKLIKSFNNETVYIIGYNIKDVEPTFILDKPFSSFRRNCSIKNKDSDSWFIETQNEVYIITEPEYFKYISNGQLKRRLDLEDWFVEENFTGNLYIDVYDGYTEESIFEPTYEDFLSKPIIEQVNDDTNDSWYDVTLIFEDYEKR